MTPDERSRVLSLVTVPGGASRATRADFVESFGAADGVSLGLDLLEDAVRRSDPLDVELALVVCFAFGFTKGHRPLLELLAIAEWHQRHEDVASALGRVGSATSIRALTHLARWVPEYLDYDDSRALATKSIWSIGAIAGEHSHRALVELAQSDSPVVAACAKAQLEK